MMGNSNVQGSYKDQILIYLHNPLEFPTTAHWVGMIS